MYVALQRGDGQFQNITLSFFFFYFSALFLPIVRGTAATFNLA